MTNTSHDAANALLNGGGGPSAFKFTTHGEVAKGAITDLGTQQVRDFKTGQPRTYDDGNPIMQIVITLRQDDGELGRLFVKPAMKIAIAEAVRASGADGLTVGSTLAVQYTGDEAPTAPGLSGKKLFKAEYKPASISADQLI